MCLACRLARLTPSSDIVRPPSVQIRQFPRNRRNRRNYHQFSYSHPKSTCRLFLPADSSSGEEAPGILDARLIEIQMSISRRYEHILPNGNERTRGEGAAPRSGGIVNAECFSCLSRCRKRSPDRAHVCSRIFCSVDEDLKLQGCTSMLFYSRVGQANMSRFRGRSLLVTSAATSATDVSPSNVQHDQRL